MAPLLAVEVISDIKITACYSRGGVDILRVILRFELPSILSLELGVSDGLLLPQSA